MPQDKQAHAEYMRKRRETERSKTSVEQEIDPEEVQPVAATPPAESPDTCYEHSFRRTDDGKLQCRVSGQIYPKGTPTHTDGLPDWDRLIAQMPVKGQQQLLGRITKQ